MDLERVSAPQMMPVTSADLIAQSRIDDTGEEALLDRLIATAVSHVESATGRSLMRQDWCLTLDAFPVGGLVRLPKGPVVEVLSVLYLTAAGDEVEVPPSGRRLIGGGALLPRLVPAVGHAWPVPACAPGAVRITYRTGVESAADVPEALRHAVLMLAAHWFEQREAVAEASSGAGMLPVPMAVESLMAPWVVPWVA